MILESNEVVPDIGILEHVMAGECFKGRHPEEFEVEVHRPEQVVHASSAKKRLIRIAKRLHRGIVGD